MATKRNFVRFPSGHAAASIDVADETLTCHLINESANGLAVSIPKEALGQFSPGSILKVRTNDLVITARIVRCDDEGVLGLERLDEETLVEPASAVQSVMGLLQQGAAPSGAYLTFGRDAFLVIGMAVVALAAWLAFAGPGSNPPTAPNKGARAPLTP